MRVATALLSLIMIAACGSPRETYVVERLSFPEEDEAGGFELASVALGSEARTAFTPGPNGLRSGAVPVSGGAILRGAHAATDESGKDRDVATPGFEISASGPTGRAVLLERPAGAARQPGRWQHYELPVPAELGSPLSFRFALAPGPDAEPPARGHFSVPRIASPTSRRHPNVIVISLDTVRADRMSVYGHDRATTPFLDELARKSVVLSEAIAPYASTLTSHWSLFTGLYPASHGVYSMRGAVANQAPALAEILEAAGYLTVAFTEGGFVHSLFGFGRGFESYDNGREHLPKRFTSKVEQTFGRAITWIEDNRDSQFFVFIHSYQAHMPYEPPREYVELFDRSWQGRRKFFHKPLFAMAYNNGKTRLQPGELEHIGALYDAEILQLDREVEKLHQNLAAMALLDDTLVVITSDHGEDLAEHHWLHHGTTLYDPALRVPAIFSWRGVLPRGAVLDCQRPTIDILPTLLDLVGVTAPGEIDGESFAREARAGVCRTSRSAFAEMRESLFREPDLPIGALREDGWKFIFNAGSGRGELYDLRSDPDEQANLVDSEPERAALMRADLRAYMSSDDASSEPDESLTPEVEAQLRALGYLE